MTRWNDFIPGTSPRKIAEGIWFQPIRSWSSLTYAGEGLREHHLDRSGCVDNEDRPLSRPYTVTHRIYWNDHRRISAFLSYPGRMGTYGHNQYFWEIYPIDGDIERFGTEDEMEKRIIEVLSK